MGAFEANTDMYFLPIINMVHDAGDKRAGHDLLRESIFLRLLAYSASDYYFADANHFAKVANVPDKQAELVWNLCKKEGVLMPSNDGFSARMWLATQGLLVKNRATRAQTSAVKKDALQKSESDSDSAQVIEVKPVEQQENNDFVETAPLAFDREIKEFVRPNVRLSRKEIISLKDQFSDEEIAKILDKLSQYKTNSGRQYSSDYQAIMRWGYKALNESKIKESKKPATFDIPDWMLGADR